MQALSLASSCPLLPAPTVCYPLMRQFNYLFVHDAVAWGKLKHGKGLQLLKAVASFPRIRHLLSAAANTILGKTDVWKICRKTLSFHAVYSKALKKFHRYSVHFSCMYSVKICFIKCLYYFAFQICRFKRVHSKGRKEKS